MASFAVQKLFRWVQLIAAGRHVPEIITNRCREALPFCFLLEVL